MKHEWKIAEKNIYVPSTNPEFIEIPSFCFFKVEGKGNPNDSIFSEYIKALYALSYAVKMYPKKATAPEGFCDYTVYPLEGIWDISDEAKKTFNGRIDKNTLVFNLMIRQPNFVTDEFAKTIMQMTKEKKPNTLLSQVKFGRMTEGKCVQMLHIGDYDSEPKSFKLMEEYCAKNGLTRVSKKHREIYLSDARKVRPEKLQTVLRFNVRTEP